VRHTTIVWLATLLACVAVGILMGFDGRVRMPRHFGYYIAVASLLAGLSFGWRGLLLPASAIVTFGLARLLISSGEDGERALFVLYFTYIPAVFTIPALLGAAIHAAARRLTAQPD
jgi:hypothetical protein